MTRDQAIRFLRSKEQEATSFVDQNAFRNVIKILLEKGAMTVKDAGRKGGITVRDERGHDFYEEIGRKGGHKVRDLIAAGKRALAERKKP